MKTDVKIIEGGKVIGDEQMKLTLVKEFSNDVSIYENEAGRAVVHFKSKDEFILISVDMA